MNLFEMALTQFDRAASHMDLNDGIYRVMRVPKRELAVTFQGIAQVAMGVGIIRFQFQSPPVTGDRFGRLLHGEIGFSEVIVEGRL